MRGAKTLYIKTFGCQMNVYDSRRMADILASHGYVAAATPERADLIVLNTCHIREKAAEKVYSEIGRLKPFRDAGAVIAVAGCVAQAEGAEMIARAPAIDLVFGPQTYHRLPDLLRRIEQGAGPLIDTEFPAESKFDHMAPAPRGHTRARGPAAFLSVQEGCDKFCTFCVVPYTRGSEASRPVDHVRREAERLVEAGVREITLLGQNVNAYHGAGPDGAAWGLAGLLRMLARISGLDRLRYTTSHPRDMSDELIAVHREVEEVMPCLHLPVQSGSDAILRAMNRKHTASDYIAIIERLRASRNDIALSSDFIVGFPGESDADFDATLQLVNTVTFAQSYSFKFSPRPGTPAADLPGQVPDTLKAERLEALQSALSAQQRAFNEACMGRRVEVLFERRGREPGQLVGRSPYLQAVHVMANEDRLGTIAGVEITGIHPNSLSGHLDQGGGGTSAALQRAAGDRSQQI